MELYLLHSDLPIVLTKPGLLDVDASAPIVTVGTETAKGVPEARDIEGVSQGTPILSEGDQAGQLVVQQIDETQWPAADHIRIRYSADGKVWKTLPAGSWERVDDKNIRITWPAEVNGSTQYQIEDNTSGTWKALADGDAPIPTRTITNTTAETAPAQPDKADPNSQLNRREKRMNRGERHATRREQRATRRQDRRQRHAENTTGFTNSVNGVTNGTNAVGNMVNSVAGVGNSVANVGYAGRNVGLAFGNNPAYYGYGASYGTPAYGAPIGFGAGIPGLGLGLQNNPDQYHREESRRISMLLYQLMHAIQMGNLDAIPTALTMISLRGKRTLLQAAGRAVRAMESFERQQQIQNDNMAALSPENNPSYASNLQAITHQMNTYSNQRQAVVNFLRDIKAMSDELENMEKSWLDNETRQAPRLLVWG